jgi:hypothetical protein
MIRFESLSAMRTVIYKNYNKNDGMFNISEIRIRKVVITIFSLLIIITTSLYVYRVSKTLRSDLRTLYDGHTLDYNLKLLTLQLSTDNRLYGKSLGGILLGVSMCAFLNVSFLSMSYYMYHHQNYQFTKDGKSLIVFFIALVMSLIVGLGL